MLKFETFQTSITTRPSLNEELHSLEKTTTPKHGIIRRVKFHAESKPQLLSSTWRFRPVPCSTSAKDTAENHLAFSSPSCSYESAASSSDIYKYVKGSEFAGSR
jgi:hypothetical protein